MLIISESVIDSVNCDHSDGRKAFLILLFHCISSGILLKFARFILVTYGGAMVPI